MRKLVMTLVVLVAVVAPAPARAQAAADSAAIREAALNYIQGWYTGDAERMESALHPQLAKRIVERDANGRSRVAEMTAATLVEGTRRGGGSRVANAPRRSDVRILDLFGSTASVRVDADRWVDYLHMAKVDGRWRIINVLWEMRPAARS